MILPAPPAGHAPSTWPVSNCFARSKTKKQHNVKVFPENKYTHSRTYGAGSSPPPAILPYKIMYLT